jgi:hypothetical protein
MLNALCELFEAPFARLQHLELDHVTAVYASPQQLFAIATYQNEEELQAEWQKAAHEVAYKIQGRLQGEHDQLRWDIYLLLLVTDNQVAPEVRKRIENDQRYFRKLVLTAADHPFAERLPFRFAVKEQERVLLFEEGQFLQELKGCLSEAAVERLGDALFAMDKPNDEEMLRRLRERFAVSGGESDENPRG